MLIHLISSDIETVNLLTVIKFLSSLQTYVKSSTMRVAHPCKDDKVLFIVACTNIQDFTNQSNYSPEILFFMKVAKHIKRQWQCSQSVLSLCWWEWLPSLLSLLHPRLYFFHSAWHISQELRPCGCHDNVVLNSHLHISTTFTQAWHGTKYSEE